MALTFTKYHSGVVGDRREWVGKIAFDSSYPTGGEVIAATDFDLSSAIHSIVIVDNTGANTIHWDQANSKLLVFTADGTQASNSSNQSAVNATAMVRGV